MVLIFIQLNSFIDKVDYVNVNSSLNNPNKVMTEKKMLKQLKPACERTALRLIGENCIWNSLNNNPRILNKALKDAINNLGFE